MPTKLTRTVPAKLPVPAEMVARRIFLIRGSRVMLSPDLAELYQVETRALVQAVKRNAERFPADFMFQLTASEFANLKSQFVISSWGGARRAAPYAFTELGVAMLSSVLHSKRAIQMNVTIMRAFVKLREVIAGNRELSRRLDRVEASVRQQGAAIAVVVDEIKRLSCPPARPKRPIGFLSGRA